MYFLQYVHMFIFSTSVIQFGTLLYGFSLQVADPEEVLRSVLSINLKDNRCNFFKIYIYLVLVENWLFSTEQTPVILRMWGAFLRSCSCQITSTDWRSYASKVCNCTGAFGSPRFCLWVPSSIIFFFWSCRFGTKHPIFYKTRVKTLTNIFVGPLFVAMAPRKETMLSFCLCWSLLSLIIGFFLAISHCLVTENFSCVVTLTLDHMIGTHGDAFDLSLLF